MLSGKEIKRVLKRTTVFLLSLFLVACSGSSRPASDGDAIKINLLAASDINPNEMGEPAPLNIFIYNVKDLDALTNADFYEIVEGTSKRVQAAASKVYEAILQPGESRTILIKPDGSTRSLAFIGAYRSLNYSLWLASWDLPVKKKSWWRPGFFSDDSLELNARFQKTAITIKVMD
ncbi:type VI secretion system lipoprotein TssJ [Citrobacter rodentium]|uniref:T6SS protein Cts1N n=2 Tax=Citrobacter rodentium TaxID=67825 RepID=D2THT3_CITRI|nr:type VI secretion system lipoprotein TssJ [Citrobacter rodentium]KIQ49584.1 type VI secretion protein [Citrobacter rodentium]CBG89516.1 T6SS protein Cts1N [Citrobacter rodentium ICC168]